MAQRNRLMDFAAPDLVPPLPASRPPQIDGLSLLFGDDQAPDMIQVQEGGAGAQRRPAPVNRPAPVDQDALRGYQPKNIPPAKRAAEPTPSAPAEPPKLDGLDLLFGDGQSAPAAPAPTGAPAMPDPNAEPDASTWIGRRWQDIRGRVDPRYQGLGDVVSDNPELFPQVDQSAMKMAAPGDEAYHDIIKQQLGPNYIRTETDANGSKVMVYKDLKTGAERKSYVNRPGLDWQDFDRGMFGALPYVVAGSAVGRAIKGAPILGRAVAQGLAGALTSGGQDVVAGEMGSEQGVDPWKAGFAAAGGAAGELAAPAVGYAWRKLVTEPRYYNRATGQLTEEGARIARNAGLDPNQTRGEIAREFAKVYAQTGNEATAEIAASSAGSGLKIPKTQGQISKDPQQLLKEESMRYGYKGEAAQQVIKNQDAAQARAIEGAVMGRFAPTPQGMVPGRKPDTARPSLTQMVAPERGPGDYNKGTVGAGIQGSAKASQEAAKAADTAAWEKVGPLEPTRESFDLLRTKINQSFGDLIPDAENTPLATKMLNQLSDFVAGRAPAKAAEIVDAAPVRTVNTMRKRLGAMVGAAEKPEDRSLAGSIYNAFNDWIDEAASAQLLKGDPVSATMLVAARGIHREMKTILDGSKGTPQARILEQVFGKADSPENVVNALFTGPTAQIKQGSAAALGNLKQAFDRYLPAEQAASAWGDVKLAYVLRMVQKKDGLMESPQNMLNNLRQARSTQGTVFNMMFDQAEKNYIGQLERELSRVVYKDPNPSKSAIAGAVLMKEFMGKLWDAIGIKSKAVQTLGDMTGVKWAQGKWYKSAAEQAVDQRLRGLPAPTLGQYGAAAGSQTQN